MHRTRGASPILLSLLSLSILSFLVLSGLPGCVGTLTLEPEDEVSPGQALGFDYINYVAQRPAPSSTLLSEILEIDTDGRTAFATVTSMPPGGQVVERFPYRFLSDRQLFNVRLLFTESDFFAFSDSTYGDPFDLVREAIIYQVDGRNDVLVRYGEAPVPPQIQALFDQVQILVNESREWDQGQAMPMTPVIAGGQTRISDREFVVVRSQDALLNLLWRVGSSEVSVLPTLDYSREMMACAFLGDDIASTARIIFDSTAHYDGQAVRVRYRRVEFEPGCERTERPFAMVRLPRVDAPVEFYEAADPDSTPAGCDE